MKPYDEQFVLTQVGPTFFALYAQAGRVFGDDPNSVVWPARTQYDIDAGMNPQQALNKHAAECAAALGIAPPVGIVPPIDPRPPGDLSPLHNDGKYFATDAGAYYYPAFASCLYALCDGKDARPALDQLAELGFTGVRVFAGALSGRGQTAAQGRERLPRFMDECLSRGLYVQVAAITDSGVESYDVRAHVRDIAAIVSEYPHGLMCLANEYWHPTQSAQVHDANYLRRLGDEEVTPQGVLWAVGAAEIDELDVESKNYPGYGGGFNQVHLQRRTSSNYPWWQEACRVKEQWDVAGKHKTPCMNGEPNKRLTDTPFYYLLGILGRGFNLGTVLHTEDGLQARPLAGADLAQAEYFLRAVRLVPHTQPFTFYNARWNGSPVGTARFVEPVPGDPAGKTVWRCYSYVLDDGTGLVVAAGPDPANAGIVWANGWRPVGVVDQDTAEAPHVQVIEIRKG